MTTIGFIGLGIMGGPTAMNFIRKGHKMIVCDVSREAAAQHLEAGASWADTPAKVAAEADVIFLSLPGPAQVRQVVLGPDGIKSGARSGQAIFDLSTNAPSEIKATQAELAKIGVDFLDAPVSGGPAGAKSGNLTIWIGGEVEVFERHKALLGEISSALMHVGPVGSATVAKLAHNCVGFVMNGVVAEVFALGAKADIDPLTFWHALRLGIYGRMGMFDTLPKHFLIGEYKPGLSLDLAFKDMSLAANLGREMKVPMKLTNLTVEEMTEALNRGWGQRDARTVMQLELERAGVSIAVPAEDIARSLEPAAGK